MLIDAQGLNTGERLGSCSDIAQLHYPRLLVAANDLGRIELSYSKIISTIYNNFHNKPTEAEISAWLRDYEEHYLLFIYAAPDGSVWGQWITDPRNLPRHKRRDALRSPAPPQAELEAYQREYMQSRKGDYISLCNFQKPAATCGSFTESSEDCEDLRNVSQTLESCGTFARGVGNGKGDGNGEVNTAPLPPTRTIERDPDTDRSSLVERIICAHPRSLLRNLEPADIRQAQSVAVFEAAKCEMDRAGCLAEEALHMILERTRSLAEHIPREEWRFLKDVPEFYRSRDYRLEPSDFAGRQHGSNRNQQRTNGNRDAARRAAQAIAGGDPDSVGGGAASVGQRGDAQALRGQAIAV